ncbi:MAG: hypothetical protein ACYDGY_06930 [Acidimicrobiales bacterium]
MLRFSSNTMVFSVPGASSGKAEDEGVAWDYVEEENAARDVIWSARPRVTHERAH